MFPLGINPVKLWLYEFIHSRLRKWDIYYILVFNQTLRVEDLPRYLVVDFKPLKQIFLLGGKKTPTTTTKNPTNTKTNKTCQLSHSSSIWLICHITFIGLTRCFTFETLILPHTQHFLARGSMNQAVSKQTIFRSN